MIDSFLQLIVLFFVIIDPLASLAVFFAATSNMDKKQRKKTATLALTVAFVLCFIVLLFGELLLRLFSTSIDEFKVAGGVILCILGVKMALGKPLTDIDEYKANSSKAIAAIIATPLLTGPAAITAIIVSSNDYGKIFTGLAILIVLTFTAIIFFASEFVTKYLSKTTIQVVSTVLGLVTLAWGVRFIVVGIKTILLG